MIKNLLPYGKRFLDESKRQIGFCESHFAVITESCYELLVITKSRIRK